MTAQFPGTQRADLQVVRDDKQNGDPTSKAVGLLENAQRVADATVAEARAEAERLLTAARERAQQVQRDAKDLGQNCAPTPSARVPRRGTRPTARPSGSSPTPGPRSAH